MSIQFINVTPQNQHTNDGESYLENCKCYIGKYKYIDVLLRVDHEHDMDIDISVDVWSNINTTGGIWKDYPLINVTNESYDIYSVLVPGMDIIPPPSVLVEKMRTNTTYRFSGYINPQYTGIRHFTIRAKWRELCDVWNDYQWIGWFNNIKLYIEKLRVANGINYCGKCYSCCNIRYVCGHCDKNICVKCVDNKTHCPCCNYFGQSSFTDVIMLNKVFFNNTKSLI
jgi:hypothetical protein